MSVLARIVNLIAKLIIAVFLMFVGGLMVIVAQDHPELKTEVLLTLGQWKDTVVNFDYSQWIDTHLGMILFVVILYVIIDDTLLSNRRRKSAVVFDYSQQAYCQCHYGPTGAVTLPQSQTRCQCRCWCHSGPTGAVTLPQSQTRKH
jgi:hypothetical protein